MNRRSLLVSGSAGLAVMAGAIPLRAAPPAPSVAPIRIALWADDTLARRRLAPLSGQPVVSRHGAIRNIATPDLAWYRPATPNGAAVLIAAGGGYRRIEIGREALPAARWLNAMGISAFVLTYRLPQEGWHDGRLAPFADAAKALEVIAARARDWGLDPARIGTLGFSAGGHLLGLCALRPGWPGHLPGRATPAPALNMLLYPIVTLAPPFQDTSSCRVLLGDHPGAAEADAWSLPGYVRPGDAPFFLAQAADDAVASPAQTEILAAACQRAGVPVARHLFASGGHGFGLGRAGTDSTQWPVLAAGWLRARGFIV